MTARKPGRLGGGATAAKAAVTVIVTAVVAVVTLSGDSADAARYARSNSPLWQVGHLDADLSNACRRLQFNQIQEQRHHIGFTGENGYGTVGIAKLGWNLRDPAGLARPGLTYHFFNDGHSNCKVFVAGDH
jgi:hypothetical protein